MERDYIRGVELLPQYSPYDSQGAKNHQQDGRDFNSHETPASGSFSTSFSRRAVISASVASRSEKIGSPTRTSIREGIANAKAGYAMASMPRFATNARSFAAGPLGTFSPRSHLMTMPVVTFKCAARTAWLTSALVRMRRIAVGVSFFTGVRQLRSKRCIVFLSIIPRR